MIRIHFEEKKKSILLKAEGHADNSDLCSAVSMLFKHLELTFLNLFKLKEVDISHPEEGIFYIKIDTSLLDSNRLNEIKQQFESVFLSFNWLKHKYNDIKISGF